MWVVGSASFAFDAAAEERQRRLASLTANSTVRKLPASPVAFGEIKTGRIKGEKEKPHGTLLSISLKAPATYGDRDGKCGETVGFMRVERGARVRRCRFLSLSFAAVF